MDRLPVDSELRLAERFQPRVARSEAESGDRLLINLMRTEPVRDQLNECLRGVIRSNLEVQHAAILQDAWLTPDLMLTRIFIEE